MSKQSRRPQQGRGAPQPTAPPGAKREHAFWKGLLLLIYLALRFFTSRLFPAILVLGLCAVSFSSVPLALYEVGCDLLHLPVSAAQRQASAPVVVAIWWVGILILLGLWLLRLYRRSNAAAEPSDSHWRWWLVLGFVVSLLLMGSLLYLHSTPLPPASSVPAAVNALFLPVGLALLFFAIGMLALLLEFLQAKWGEQAMERAKESVGYGCLLSFIVFTLIGWYDALRSFPPENVLVWLAYLVAIAFLPGVPIFLLLRPALNWWRASSRSSQKFTSVLEAKAGQGRRRKGE